MSRPAPASDDRDASEELLRAFVRARRAGDEALMRASWRRLLAAEWARIRAFAATSRSPALPGGRLSPDEVDDLAQAVVVRLIDKLHFAGDAVGELRAFLLRATKYAFLDHLERHIADDRRRAGSFDDRGDDAAPGRGDLLDAQASARTADALVAAEWRQLLDRAFAAVDEDKRDVVRLALEGAPAAEVAARLGISVDNAYQRRRRGTLQLRRFLEEHR